MGGGGASLALRRAGKAHPPVRCAGVVGFDLLDDCLQGLYGLDGIPSYGRLPGEHDGVRPVQDSVGDVGNLRTGWTGVADHGVEHLRRRDDRFPEFLDIPDDALLQKGHLLGACLDAEVSAGDHRAVRNAEDLLKARDGLGLFDLGDDRNSVREFLCGEDVLRRAHEGEGQVVDAQLPREAQILAVFRGERRRAELHRGQVHSLVVRQDAAGDDAAEDLLAA